MRPTTTERAQLGFTLVEMIISIMLLGLLSMAAIPLINIPMSAYMQSVARSRVTTDMDWVKSKLSADFATALPNSVRVRQVGTRYFIEFLQVHAHGRYRSGDSGVAQVCPAATLTCPGGKEDALRFGTPAVCTESCFFSLGRLVQVGSTAPIPNSDYIVVNPSNTTGTNGDPYANNALPALQSIKSRMLTLGAYNASAGTYGQQVTMTPNAFPDLTAPGAGESARTKRFYVVASSPVTYVCNTVSGALTRYWNYAITPAQPTVFGAAVSSAALSNAVTCAIALPTSVAEPAGIRGRGDLISIKLIFSAPVTGGNQPEQTELIFTAPVNKG